MRKLLAALSVIGALLGACASGGSSLAYASPSVLTVDNQYTNAVDIWVVHTGARERKVGTVEAYTQSLFVLQQSDYSTGTLQFFVYCRMDGHYLTTDAIPITVGTPVRLDLNSQGGFLWPRQANNQRSLNLNRT
ncbi:MAG TPA: hypothetical protein VJO33_17155 [Gemmatimonadaceae bacterium]|nr:hypothetical protein [Gemmatimonadaceae bacterium]